MRIKVLTVRASLYASLTTLAILTLFPLLWVTSIAFMRSPEQSAGTPPLWPRHPTLNNIVNIVQREMLGHYFLNSLIVAIATTVLSTFVAGLAGYALAQVQFRGRRVISWVVLFAVLIPSQALVLPLFEMFREVHLINHYAALILPAAANPVSIVLIQAYMRGIPAEILDAARMDGAGEWRTFFSVVVPMMAPMLAALAVLTFVVSWNDFMWPMIAMQKASMQTLPVALASIDREHYQEIGLMAAGATVTILPMMAIFVASQRYYLRSVVAGSLTD
jgi:multiple sugar transport system permease protein